MALSSKPKCKRQQKGMLYKIRRNNFDVTKLQQYKRPQSNISMFASRLRHQVY